MNLKRKFAPSRENEGANFALFIARNIAKISASGQTCGQVRKIGLFTPQIREEQAYFVSFFCLKSSKNPHVVSEWVKHVVKPLF